jgi:hypothetical protein
MQRYVTPRGGIRDIVTFAPPLVEAVAEITESSTEHLAGRLDADGVGILAASDA